MLERIYDTIKENLKNPKLYIFVLIAFIVVLVLFPYIYANMFYYNRVNSRIDVLSKISEIDKEKIQDNQIMLSEYNSILTEISKQEGSSLGSVFQKTEDSSVGFIKFITGGVLAWILSIACLFIKTFKSMGQRIAGFILIGIVGTLLGLIGMCMPTVFSPLVNYVGFPVLQFILIAILATSSSAKTNKK